MNPHQKPNSQGAKYLPRLLAAVLITAAMAASAACQAPQPSPSEEAKVCDDILRNLLRYHKRHTTTTAAVNAVISELQTSRGDRYYAKVWTPTAVHANQNPGCLANETIGNQYVQPQSGRDDDNNIIVYWSKEPARKPAEHANCWLYIATLQTWFAE